MFLRINIVLVFCVWLQFAIAQPNTISNLRLWLRSDSAIVLNGPLVSQWGDISGYANHATQTIPANQPLYIADGGGDLNNYPTIQFSASRLAVPDFMTSGQATAFMIYRVNDTVGGIAGYSAILSLLNGVEVFALGGGGYPSPCFIGKTGGVSAKGFVGIDAKDSLPHALTVGYNGGDVSQNSSYSGSYNLQESNIQGIGAFGSRSGSTIGDRDLVGFYFKGDIAEIIVYDTILLIQQRQQIENYLRNRYAPEINLGPDLTIPYGFCGTNLDGENRFVSYSWSSGDTTQIITINKSGTYAVSVTDVFGLISSDTVDIVYPGNLYPFPDTTICLGDTLIWDTQLDTLFYDIQWQDSSKGPSLVISGAGIYYLSVTDTLGCVYYSDTLIILADSFSVTASLGPDDTLCAGSPITLIIGSAQTANYYWSTSDTTSTITVDSGMYWVSVIDTLGCGASDSVFIYNKGLNPSAYFSSSDDCLGDSILFLDSSFSQDTNTIISWYWSFGDGVTSTVQNPHHYYDSAGQYVVTLTVITSAGCQSEYSDSVNVYSFPDAVAGLDNNLACAGVPLYFMDNSSIEYGNIISWIWDFGDGDTSAFANPSHIYDTEGEFNIKLVVGNDLGCMDTAFSFVKVFSTGCDDPSSVDALQLWLRPDSGVVLSGSLVSLWGDLSGKFNNASQGIPANQPEFIGNGGDDINNHPVVRFVSSRLTLPDFISTGKVTTFLVYRVNDTLGGVAGFSVIISLLNGVEIYPVSGSGYSSPCFIGKIGGSSGMGLVGIDEKNTLAHALTLEYNGGNVSQDSSYWASYNLQGKATQGTGVIGNRTGSTIGDRDAAGFYFKGDIAEIIVYDTTLTIQQIQQIEDYLHYRYAPPVNLGPNITVPYGFCNTLLDAESRFVSYLWSTGDTTQTINVNKEGSYAVLVTDIFGFTSSDTVNVSYPGNLIPPSDSTICMNASFIWNTGLDTSIYSLAWQDTSGAPAFTISQAGTYYVNITDDSGCTFSSDTLTVTIDSFQITAALDPTDTVCAGNPIQLIQGAASASEYLWSTGDTTASIPAVATGNYSLTVTDTNGCTAQDTVFKTVIGTAPGAAFAFTPTCLGEATSFTDNTDTSLSGSLDSWLWDFGDGNGDTVPNPAHSYSAAGTFTATLQVATADGCGATASQNITVHSLPAANFDPVTGCSDAPLAMQDLSTITVDTITGWLWYVDGVITDSVSAPVLVFPDSGEYWVALTTTTNQGCTNTVTKTVNIKESPLPGFDYVLTCASNTVAFSDTSVINSSYLFSRTWNFGDGNNATTNPVTHTYLNTGDYLVTLTVQAVNGCTASTADTISVAPITVKADFTGDDICVNSPHTFLDASTVSGDVIALWYWDLDPLGTSGDQNPAGTYADSGSYLVSLAVTTAKGCVDSMTQVVIVHGSPTVDFDFSPQFGVNLEEPVGFVNSSAGCISYLWDFGDGTDTVTIANPTHQYADSGIYGVTLRGISIYGCPDSLTQSVDVRPASVDVEVSALTADCQPEIIQNITVTLINRGTREITSMNLFIRIQGREPVREQWTGFLEPQKMESYTFTAAFPLSNSQPVNYVCTWAEKPNGVVDEVLANNEKCIACDNKFTIVDLFPNPAGEVIHVWFILPQPDFIEAELYDERGAYLGQAFSGTGVKGLNRMEINTSVLRHGVYALRIEYLESSYVRTFVVH